MLDIRPATLNETQAVLDFYHYMIDVMVGTDYDILWKRDVHPADKSLVDAIEAGWLMAGWTEDGKIACALVLDHNAADGYDKVPWSVPGPPEKIGILHSVATAPEFHGRGYAKKLLRATEDKAREEGIIALHFDTFTTNARSRALYKKCEYNEVGVFDIYYEDLGTTGLVMLEKVL